MCNNVSGGPVKRNASGMPSRHDAPNPAAEARKNFDTFLASLREPLAVSVMLSLLAKIHNLIVDDSSLDLVVEYTGLWPSCISNMNTYNVKYVLECLTDLLERNLKLYPYNTSWWVLYFLWFDKIILSKIYINKPLKVLTWNNDSSLLSQWPWQLL